MEPCINFLNKVESTVKISCEQIENLDAPGSIFDNCAEQAGSFLEKYLPSTAVLITKTALRSIHYTATILLLPAPLSFSVIGIMSAHKINQSSPNIGPLLNGVAFGCLINGVRSLLFLNVLACIINVVAATVLFSVSPFVQTLKNPPEQQVEEEGPSIPAEGRAPELAAVGTTPPIRDVPDPP
jgi:hypothetical protein